MRIKTRFYLLVCFVLLATTASFAAQPEIIARFRLPQETTRLMDEKSWNKLYERMLEKLPEEKFAPGRILFKLKGSPGIFLWTFDPKTDMAQMLAYVKNLPNVEYCQPDYIYTLEPYNIIPLNEVLDTGQVSSADEPNPSQPNDPWYSRQAHLGFLGMDKLFETYGPSLERLIPRGHDPYIHIVDSGGGCEHPDLNRANIIPKEDFVDWDDDPCSSPNGMHSHGEFVATIACAVSNNNHGGTGICPSNTKLVIWRVFDRNGQAFSSTVSLALSQIVSESAGFGNEIVNMSFGGPREDAFQKLFILNGSLPQELDGKNITFIGSSGNSGDQTLDYPAAHQEVISAGASEFPLAETGEIFRAGYSSYGKVDIMAPVGGFNKENNTYQDNNRDGKKDGIVVEGRLYDKDGNPGLYNMYLFLGTSGAAPIISGVTASLINLGIYGPTAIRQVLMETAGDISPLGFDQETGWGIVRADVAVMSVDDSLPVFGSFSQDSYICTVIPDKSTCKVSINYKVKPNGFNVYLYDNYNEGSFRDLGNSEFNGSVDITVDSGEKTWVLLLYYPDRTSNDFWGDPKVFASTVVTGMVLSLPPTGSLSGNNCTLALGNDSCASTISYNVENNGWNVYIWDNINDPWSNTAVRSSGTKTATVKSGATTHIRLYYCPENNGTPGNCLGKTDLPVGLDLNANPTPPPTAFIIANGRKDLSVNVGDTINYLWFSNYADSANSSYTSTCGSGQWVANTDFGYISAVVLPFQVGCTYTITYYATQSTTGKTASDTITVRVR